jgi:beta-lactam-binding protein with PASTA domain
LELEHVFNGRYRVDDRLGTGGMAIVYCGTDLLLRRRVAIKVLRDQFSADDDFIKRFSYEAQSAAKLSHPNVVNVYDFGHEGDAYFIVMELVEGETLAAMLRNERRIPESVAIDYATQIAAGLAFAHRQGLLHRDVKPANILVTGDDVVKLGDFGIARAVAENAIGVTQPGMVMGSVAYVSPEQAQGRELDARSDLYSLGVVLYQMVTGRLPFNADTPVAVALKHVSEPAPQLDPFRDGVSPALASIVATLLQKNPKDRFDSATELGRALREAREQPALTVGSGSRNAGDAPTSQFRSVAPTPPPRVSAAPDRPPSSVAYVEEEPPPPLFDRRWIPFMVLLLVVSLVAGYIGVHAIGPRKDITIASFSGRSSMQAQQSLVAAGLQPNVRTEASETVPADRVIRQDPAAGTLTSRGAPVVLYVSSGAPLVAVPDVKGFTASDAQHMLAGAKFRTKVVQRYDKTGAKDTVLDVSPAGGSNAAEGSTITLTVSQGRQPVRVPQVVGSSLDTARKQLEGLGLKLNVDQQTASDLIPSGTIISQAQSGGSTVDPGSTIGVTVSTGPVPVAVPDVSGKAPADASTVLQTAGFVPRVQYIVDATNAGGNVAAQDPAAGTMTPRRSTVTISVAVPGTVPDVTNMSLDDAKNAIIASGYTVGNVAVTQDGPEGKVARTEPEANASLRPGEAVTIYYHAVAGQ